MCVELGDPCGNAATILRVLGVLGYTHTGAKSDAHRRALDLRDTAMVELLYGPGLRGSEACGLDLDDLDLRDGWVTVLGKGDKERRVPMGEPSAEAMTVYLDRARVVRGGPETPTEAVFLALPRGRRAGVRDV